MFDHINLRTNNLDALVPFYRAVLSTLGYSPVMEFPGAIGFGTKTPDFCISNADLSSNVHLALRATRRSDVDAFHRVALEHGGRDNGAPGLRDYGPNYYAAFVIDPDGNNIEVVCHAP